MLMGGTLLTDAPSGNGGAHADMIAALATLDAELDAPALPRHACLPAGWQHVVAGASGDVYFWWVMPFRDRL